MKNVKRFGSWLLTVLLVLQVLTTLCFAEPLAFTQVSETADVVNQKITIQGVVSGGHAQQISIRVFKDSDLLYVNQIKSNDDGSFKLSFPVAINSGDSLKFLLGGDGVTTPLEQKVVAGNGSSGNGGSAIAPEKPTKKTIAYIQGDAAGLFHPNDAITRAEVCMIFARLGTGTENFTGKYTSNFQDVATGSWYYDCVGYAQSTGLVKGYSDGNFQPDMQITRAEFSAIIARYAKLENGTTTSFSDVPANYWAAGFISALAQKKWVGGYEDGSFRPNQSITRAEAVTIINRMMGLTVDKAIIDAQISKLTTFTDVTSAHWAYYNILLAANGQ